MLKLILILFLFFYTDSYNFDRINNFYGNMIKNIPNKIHCIKPKNANDKNIPAIIFLTGGSSFIAPFIYNSFLYKLALNNIAVYCPGFNYKTKNSLIDKLNKKHKEVIIMGHSSGGTTAINYAKNDNIKKLILLDGVDTRFINKETKNKLHNLQNLNSILYIKANKSYNITYDPYGLPFIPILSINNDILNLTDNCKTLTVNSKYNGHGDILDKYFSDILHYTRISVGMKNRDHQSLNNYKIWLTYTIKNWL